MFLEKCEERFAEEKIYASFPMIRTTVLEKMGKYLSERFFELLLKFNYDNQRYFINHLGCTLRGDDPSQAVWLIYNYEEEVQYNISTEILDLIEGFLCTVEVDVDGMRSGDKHGYWRMEVI